MVRFVRISRIKAMLPSSVISPPCYQSDIRQYISHHPRPVGTVLQERNSQPSIALKGHIFTASPTQLR